MVQSISRRYLAVCAVVVADLPLHYYLSRIFLVARLGCDDDSAAGGRGRILPEFIVISVQPRRRNGLEPGQNSAWPQAKTQISNKRGAR